jgi:alpha-mannosidase
VDVTDTLSGSIWRGVTGRAYAVPELGNDVTLATDEGSRSESVVESVEVVDRGPIVVRVRIRWSLLAVVWTTTIQVWADSERVDIETEVDWPGFENWQVRMPMASVPRPLITHGTPFHASGWEDVPEGVRPLSRDEISADDLASYREVQHWVHVSASDGAAGLAILTQHPAFHHDGNNLEAVLLRTAPSCGDPRMAWTNPGRTTWAFRLVPVASDWREADLPELADVEWRRPRILPNAAQARQQLLVNTGETVRLSALFVDPDGCAVARLVNQSDTPRAVQLSGSAVGDSAQLVDLDGNTQQLVRAVDGVLSLDLAPWRIQTINLGALATSPVH